MFAEILYPKIVDIPSVSEELRGWNWKNPPVAPLLESIKLGIWEVTSRYCATRYDAYLHRVLKVSPRPTKPMLLGRVVHDLFVETFKCLKKAILEEPKSGSELYYILTSNRKKVVAHTLERFPTNLVDDISCKLNSLYNHLSLQISADYDRLMVEAPRIARPSIADRFLTISCERPVDGSRLGLSSWLMVDIYAPPIGIVEVKTGPLKDFHELSLSGYALAMESSEYAPINFGQLMYVYLNNGIRILRKLVRISDELRKEFLEERDKLMEILYHERDPGLPNECPESCPYYFYCKDGKV
ncbi:MAG: type I-A CRISPR-associated protein Cas4/Csa1 [Nitrososphaerota archaeon]